MTAKRWQGLGVAFLLAGVFAAILIPDSLILIRTETVGRDVLIQDFRADSRMWLRVGIGVAGALLALGATWISRRNRTEAS